MANVSRVLRAVALRAWTVGLVAGGSFTCSSLPNTEIVVVVSSDLPRGSTLRAVRVIASRDGARIPMLDETFSLEGSRLPLPGDVVLVSTDPDDARPVNIQVIGDLRVQSLRQDARTSFSRGQTIYVDIHLGLTCVATSCTGERTCRLGACVLPTEVPVTAMRPGRAEDAGGPAIRDAKASQDVGSERCPADMVYLPGGRFSMGSDDGADDERPVHAVRISPFCVDRTEVTREAYGRCVASGSCSPPIGSGTLSDFALNFGRSDRVNHPINGVQWVQARDYCLWHGLPGGPRQLPTEAQWEFAARGEEGRLYPLGDDPARVEDACWSANAMTLRTSTCPVASSPATRDGVHDLAGNVYEWVEDCYRPYAGDLTTEVVDPRAEPCRGEAHVFRGGAFHTDTSFSIRGARRRAESTTRSNAWAFGFRCARVPF